MAETWKDIPGYEGYYQVSDMGNVRSLDRVVPRGNGTLTIKGKRMIPQSNNYGAQVVVLMKNRQGKQYKVHRLVALCFIPNPGNLPCVNHLDGNRRNNRVSNLEWCTYGQNNQHAYDTSLKVPYNRNGERNPKAKFTDAEAAHIRAIHRYKSRQFGTMALARRYGVHRDTITNLISGRTYCSKEVS